ncbi:serine/threonine-protein kinase [Candidatus Uabimicrobium amorphum]|uniref:Serine/threonine protein kinase n=1 Tax=Uabimicrobium amorphum TaxID=2596890 RepID=A0A5S9F2Z7_UABAM|nr:serine/threonine-protein kinase [Candidatus Uabimicrobium amorphum]BBM84217.1 serine/threonine protein kinase [Candidatus Uabimicrobium amorphum]
MQNQHNQNKKFSSAKDAKIPSDHSDFPNAEHKVPDTSNAIGDSFFISSQNQNNQCSEQHELSFALACGETFSRYFIHEELGRGGMGIVYKAFDKQLQRVVALKIVLEARHRDIQRFRLESAAMAQLNHPGITSLYEFGETPRPHFTMEYVDGCTLADLVQQKNIKPLFLINVLTEVCQALAHAHQKGIVHRDIKPSNIMFTKEGQTKIMDFGLAKVHNFGDKDLSKTGDIIGSIHYMAPEQINGKANAQSDIYSFGATMYEALTYQCVHDGDSFQNILFDILNKTPILPRQINPKISPYLEAICLKCLEKKPQERYENFKQLVREFKNLKNNRPIMAKPHTAWDGMKIFAQRYGFICAGILTLVTAVLATFMITQWALNIPKHEVYAKEASIYKESGQYQKALVFYSKALAQNPNYALAYRERAFVRINQKDYYPALTDINKAIHLEKQNPINFQIQGYAHVKLGQYQKALDSFTHALLIKPTYILYIRRSEAYTALRQYEKAVEDLNMAITIDANRTSAYGSRGNIYLALRNYKRALQDFDQVISMNPNDDIAYNNRATLYTQLKQYDKALRDLDIAASINPKDVKIYYNRGLLYRKIHLYEKSIEPLSQAIRLQPNYANAYSVRARSFYQLRRYREAMKDINKAISITPYWNYYLHRSNFYSDFGKHQEALRDLNRAIKLSPKNHLLYTRRGYQYAFLQKHDIAIQNYNTAISLNRKNVDAYYYKALSYATQKKYQLALEDLSRAMYLSPRNYQIRHSRGELYLSLKKYHKALNDFNECVKKIPNNYKSLAKRGVVYAHLKKPQKAMSDLQQAIDLNPDYPNSYVCRGEVFRTLRQYKLAIQDWKKALSLGYGDQAGIKKQIKELQQKMK